MSTRANEPQGREPEPLSEEPSVTTAPAAGTPEQTTRPPRLQGAGGRRAVTNNIMVGLMIFATVLAVIPLVWVLWSVISQGIGLIVQPTWWTMDQEGLTDRRAGGGALHGILGTIMVGLITTVISVPLAILGAIFLVEYARGTQVGRIVSFGVDILSGIPSIVAALFVYALTITTLPAIFHYTGQVSAFAAALALVILMIPVVLRSTEEMLKLVPDSLREAAFALGIPRWKTILRVVVPTAFGGIATGVILGMARVMGETAPLIVLTVYTRYITLNPAEKNVATLPTLINAGRSQPDSMPGYARLWGAALTLIIIVMGLNLLARLLGWLSTRKLNRK